MVEQVAGTPVGVQVTADGVWMPTGHTATIDVLLDQRRVWSFEPSRDGRKTDGVCHVAWPKPLRPFLTGVAEVTLREHVNGRVVFEAEVRFGSSAHRVEVVNSKGQPMAVDKTDRLVRMFTERRDDAIADLLDKVTRVLGMLHDDAKVDAYLVYGALLGAVRTGQMIGHDSDADVSYLSRYTHPVDITLESFRIERLVRSKGWRTVRMSSADFKIQVPARDGDVIGIDVFASFYVDDVYYLMGEIRGELPVSAVLPTAPVELEGRQVVGPADPRALLELTYGPGWAVPDPAFHFTTPRTTRRRLNGWMRGENTRRRYWEEFAAEAAHTVVPDGPSPFAHWVADRGTLADYVVDVGCGTARDSFGLAARNAHVVGLDYARTAIDRARRRAAGSGLSLEFQRLNLYETREVLTTGAILAHRHVGQPVDVYARLLLTAVQAAGRINFWRFLRLLLPLGGRAYLEFRTPQDRDSKHIFTDLPRHYLEPEQVAAEAERIGAIVEETRQGRGLAVLGDEDPHVCQMVLKQQVRQ